MVANPTQSYFRRQGRMIPWLVAAAILFAGAYLLALFSEFTGWAVIAFVAGLIVAALGIRYVTQPAARLSARRLMVSDPRGLPFKGRVYLLDEIKRATLVTHSQSVPNRLRRGVLMINLTGVPAERIEAFIRDLRERDIQVDP
jgi:hypothetical protein